MAELTCERLVLGDFPSDVETEHLERYKWASQYAKGMDVLDVACGSGYGSKMLADAGARRVRGFDLASDAIEHAKSHHIGENLSYAVGNAEDLSQIADASIDLFVSFETIEHLPHVEKYLGEVQRVLRPGGRFLVSTPDRRLASTMYPLRGKPNNPFHLFEFTEREFLEALGRRFTVERIAGQAFVPRALVFWPLQVFLKALCYGFRKFGAYGFIRNHYHLGSGFSVQERAAHKGAIARYWVIVCRKSGSGHGPQC